METIIEIRELRSFVHIARVGSVSRAAAELYIAQPALSRQIAKLEAELGTPLFVRYGRGVRLTSAGAQLLERAEMIINFVTQTSEQVRASADRLSGHIALGLPPAVGVWVSAPIVEAFRERWPAVSLHMREGLSSSLQEWLLDRRVDLAIVYNQPPLEAFDVLPLCSEAMVIAGPPGDTVIQERGGEPLRIRDLAELPLIVPGFPHANRRVLEQAAVQHGVHLRIVLEVDSVTLTKALVRRGLGYALLTYTAIQEEVQRGDLQALPIERPSIRSTVALATLREQRASRLVRTMSDVVAEKLHDLATVGAWKDHVTWLGDNTQIVEEA
ncbi:LysR substrate-binding domain-containing protein [Paraburkholderia agricolaris]|uniref:LysR substrate-binding domain-containing protein n=1 Tax=Paraburkholderia agricolaris TaxID=2152888 RepID=UPI001FE7E6C6|nr:LysR substrate-binding domain-containing protein [Paraburkholderia agricolaris]